MRNNSLLSLFCGCGSFDYGISAAGFRVALALDINKDAVASYNLNRRDEVAEVCDLSHVSPGWVVEQCLKKADARSFVGVIGGAPCQSFSHGNVHKRADDVRHALPNVFGAIVRAMAEKCGIDFFVFENVTGLRAERHEAVFDGFKAGLQRHFTIREAVLDAVDYKVPQKRPRVFVVGVNKRTCPGKAFTFPLRKRTPWLTVRDVISGLPEPVISPRGSKPETSDCHPNHRAMAPRSKRFSNGSLKEGSASGRSFRVLSWDKPSWTVAYGNREVHVHPSGKRRLSVFEAMLLQGFPKAYKLTGSLSSQIKQVSDAVPRQFGQAIGEALKRQLMLGRVQDV